MNTQETNTSPRTNELRFTRRAKVIAALAGAGLAVLGAEKIADHLSVDFEGSHTVVLSAGDTLSDIANQQVDGGASHTQDVVAEIIRRNPDVFQGGDASIDGDDLGATIDVPDSVR